MSPDSKKIGARIAQAREYAGMNKKELADKVGVSPSTVTRYENGIFDRVKIAVIEAFARATGVNPAWIDGTSDKMVLSDADRFGALAEEFNRRNFCTETMAVSKDEKGLVTVYRECTPENKTKVRQYADSVLDVQKQEQTLLLAAHKRTDAVDIDEKTADEHDMKIMEDF